MTFGPPHPVLHTTLSLDGEGMLLKSPSIPLSQRGMNETAKMFPHFKKGGAGGDLL